VHLFSAPDFLYRVSLRPAHAGADRVDITHGCRWTPVWVGTTPIRRGHRDYPMSSQPRGLQRAAQTGPAPDVVTRYGGGGDRQILICGGPKMVEGHQGSA